MTFLLPDPESFQSGGNHYNRQLLQALQRLGISYVEAHRVADIAPDGPVFVDTLLAQANLPPNRPRWLIVHHLQSLYPPAGYTSSAYFQQHEAHLLRQFDGFLVSSPFTLDYLRQHGLKQPCIVVEPALAATPPLKNKGYKEIRAVVVANLVVRKGILPLLQQLKEQGPWPKLSLRLYGESHLQPAYAEQCLRKIAGLPEGIVAYKGAVPQAGMAIAYQWANLLISASYMETYGMALQEGRAHGLPLLVRAGGHTENHVRAGYNGQICSSIPELVSWLQRWQAHLQELEALGHGAQVLARHPARTWMDAARQFWQTYQSLSV